MRTYGKVSLAKDIYGDLAWKIEPEPQVSIRLKRTFQKIHKGQYGEIHLSATASNTRELEWFMVRYPMEMEKADRAILIEKAAEQREIEDSIASIMAEDYTPPEMEMALPPREYQKVAAALAMRTGKLLIADDLGLGKAQPLHSTVLTPNGWVKMGDLSVGDPVIDPDGGTGYITGIHPQGLKTSYKVTTKDKATSECCDEHLWGLYSANDRKRNGEMRVLPLFSFMNELTGKPSKRGWSASKWFLPLPVAIEFTTNTLPLPIDPYLLGVMLGDGSFVEGSITITLPDDEIRSSVVSLLPNSVYLVHAGKIDWRVSRRAPSGANEVIDILRQLKLYGHDACGKFVPTMYLRASIGHRKAMLTALMDTDGDCTEGGTCIFNTSSPYLKDNMIELVRSLGGIASTSSTIPTYSYKGEKRTGRRAYRVNVRTKFNPFSLPRKSCRWHMPNMARAIHSVDKSGTAEMQCISVSTKNNLYITDGHMVTHNTITALCTLTDPSNLPCLVVTLTHLPKQWESECNKFLPALRTHIVKKSTPYDMTTITVGRGKKKREEKVLFPDVIIINYHKLRGWAETIAGVTKTVIFDECQELRRSESLKTIAAAHVSANSRTRIGLSATPIMNYGGEFFNVMNSIAPDSLGTKGEFLREWCNGVYGEKPSLRDPKAFGSYLRESGLMIRRTRSEVGRELEPLTKIPHAIDANTEELSKIEDSAAELAQIILAQGEAKKGMKMMAAEQLSNVLRQATGLAKAPYVADFVRMLVESGESVLLYGWHHEVYGIWQAKLKDLNPAMYTGKQSTTQKIESKRRFVEGESKILMMSLRAGAGLDGLQHCCRTVVFGELDWSPGTHSQCSGRVHRDGQTDPVMAYYLLSEYGSDPIVADVLGMKKAQSEGVINPEASLIARSNAGGHNSKKLAEAFMKQRGLEVKEPESATVLQFTPIEVDDGTVSSMKPTSRL